jgi:hypothetical protein
MESLTALTLEMRALGIKTLTLELVHDGVVVYQPPSDRATEPPGPPPVEKSPGVCIRPGCSNVNGGVLGAAPEYCERHALEQAGVR